MGNDTMRRIIAAEGRSATLARGHALHYEREANSELARARRWRLVILGIVGGMVAYMAKGIAGSVAAYPSVTRWWGEATTRATLYALPGTNFTTSRTRSGALRVGAVRTEVATGTGVVAAKGIGLRQLCTTADYPMVSALMNLILAWKHLDEKSARFVITCIDHFAVVNARTAPRSILNLLHVQGAFEDYMGPIYPKRRIIDSTGVSVVPITADSLWSSWLQSAKFGNIWYDVFPDTQDAFVSVPMMRNLIGTTPGTETTEQLNLWQLMDGGLLGVALNETETKLSVNELFNKYFAIEYKVLNPACGAQRRNAAINGMITMAMVAPGFFNPAMGPLGVLVVGAATVGGGVAGYIVGGDAAEEQCQAWSK
jgi:hypothetical protein